MEKINNIDKFSFLEPLGHFDQFSKFERYWNNFKGPFSLTRQRIPQFSVYAGMTHFPLKYSINPFNIRTDLPNSDWVEDNLLNFVRAEFSEQETPLLPFPNGWPPKIEKEITFPEHYFEKFLEASEWANRINIKIPIDNAPSNIAESIFDLLCDGKIGSSKNKANNDKKEFIEKLIPTILDKSRLLFILPGFPFKDQNRFRVPFDADVPDMAEISFLIRLHNLVQSLYQVHPYGVDVVILTDGFLYKDIFGIKDEMVSTYMNRLFSIRNRLNLQGAISFISLKDLIDRSSNESVAWKIVDHIKIILENLMETAHHEFIKAFNILIAGMKWNLESRKSLSEYDDQTCWKILRGNENDIDNKFKEIWRMTNERASNAALEYASINLMLRWTNLISLFFPDAIRATIHPKPGQFALSGTGNTYAWNGIAFSKKWPHNIDDIRVTPYLSLVSSSKINQVRFDNSKLPCFYTESIINKNIEIAKDILPRSGWNFENINGREFLPTDINEFIKLGIGDVNFSWERKLQNENYFLGLFQFRLNHYVKYGFGIHGLWLEGNLIGQFGLQVLNENLDQIEYVVFLGQNYTKQGIGSKLTKYLLDRCGDSGFTEIYGVVRPDNHAAINLLKKMGGVQIKTVKHFNQEGILYNIKLK